MQTNTPLFRCRLDGRESFLATATYNCGLLCIIYTNYTYGFKLATILRDYSIVVRQSYLKHAALYPTMIFIHIMIFEYRSDQIGATFLQRLASLQMETRKPTELYMDIKQQDGIVVEIEKIRLHWLDRLPNKEG